MAKKGKKAEEETQEETTTEAEAPENSGEVQEAETEPTTEEAQAATEEITSETADEAPPKQVDPILGALAKFAVDQGLRDTSQIKKWHRLQDPETKNFFLVIDFYDNQGQYKRQRRDI